MTAGKSLQDVAYRYIFKHLATSYENLTV